MRTILGFAIFFDAPNLAAAVRRAHERGYRSTPVRRLVLAAPDENVAELTTKEFAVLRARSRLPTLQDVADELADQGINNENAMKAILKVLSARFEAANTTEIVTRALALGLLPAEASPATPSILLEENELSVAGGVAIGRDNNTVAQDHYRTRESVKGYLRTVFSTLGIATREQMPLAGVKAGIFVLGKVVKSRV